MQSLASTAAQHTQCLQSLSLAWGIPRPFHKPIFIFATPLQGKLCKPATAVSLAVALLLTGVMYKRFLSTGKMMPAGVVSILSAGMSIFYVWNLLAVKPPAGHHAS